MKVVNCEGVRRDRDGAKYCGRPGPLGNPYTMLTEADRDSVCDQYQVFFDWKIQTDSRFRKMVLELQGYDLACWCAPKRCHCDTILAWLLSDDAKIVDTPRVTRLKNGDWSFGHAGTHEGNGTEDCPAEPHHHHDIFCADPTFYELHLAGIDHKKFKVRSRA